MVAPVGSERRCLTRHILRSFGAMTNIYNAKSARSPEDKVDPRNPCHILRVKNDTESTTNVQFINNPAKSSVHN